VARPPGPGGSWGCPWSQPWGVLVAPSRGPGSSTPGPFLVYLRRPGRESSPLFHDLHVDCTGIQRKGAEAQRRKGVRSLGTLRDGAYAFCRGAWLSKRLSNSLSGRRRGGSVGVKGVSIPEDRYSEPVRHLSTVSGTSLARHGQDETVCATADHGDERMPDAIGKISGKAMDYRRPRGALGSNRAGGADLGAADGTLYSDWNALAHLGSRNPRLPWARESMNVQLSPDPDGAETPSFGILRNGVHACCLGAWLLNMLSKSL
jgi:hypothetical protein